MSNMCVYAIILISVVNVCGNGKLGNINLKLHLLKGPIHINFVI